MKLRRLKAGASGSGLRRAAGIGAGLALALVLGAGASPALAATAAPDGATGIWTFDGEAPLQGTGSKRFSIEKVANPDESVKVEDSGLASLGKSLSFTDKNAAHDIRVRGAVEQQKDFSVSFWVRDADDSEPTAGKRTMLLHSAGQSSSILTEWKDGTFSSSIDKADSNITLGKNPARKSWQHVTLVKQTTNGGSTKSIKLYLNGKQLGQGSWSQNLPAGAVGLVLGSWGTDSAQPDGTERFQGKIDELRLYNKALSADEAKQLYDSYDQVKAELEVADAKSELQRLIDSGTTLLADDDGSTEYDELSAAIDKAKKALENGGADAVKTAKDELSQAIGAVYALGLAVTIDTDDVARTVDDAIFGINHRYAFNGYGTFDSKAMKVKDDFARLYDEAGFGSIRYPGGTISNLFNWKETLGEKEQRTNQIHGFYNNSGQGGIAPNFGISEIGTFAQEHDSEIVYVYALGRGDANDAADLIEFLNAAAGTNPNGGTAWADVRRDLGHTEPFNVRYFEIGNEMNQGGTDGNSSQQYWTAGVPGGAEKAYIDGGTASFTNQYAITRGDWNVEKSKSTGKANQEFGMRYALVERDKKAADYDTFTAVNVDSVKVKVAGEAWERVDDITKAGASDKVYELNAKTGYFAFGDGTHGMIPAKGAQVTVDYSVNRDGFVAISQKMRDTMEQINADREKAGQTAGEIHIYSSYETEGFVNKMHEGGHDALYDGLTIHPYSGDPGNNGNDEAFYLQAMKLGDAKREHVASYVKLMQKYDPKKVPVISEYGIFRSQNLLLRSQTHALYIARAIMDYVELGSPYIQKHCLVDWYSNGADSLGPTQQAVIQAVPVQGSGDTKTGEGDFTFFKTPSASVFTMLNGAFGTNIVSTASTAMPTLSNGVAQYDLMASTDTDGNIYLAVVNLGLEGQGAVRLTLPGVDLTGRTIEVQSLSGDDFTSANTPENTDAVKIETSTLTADKAAPRIELAPHSFSILKVTAEKEPEPQPVEHTVTFDPAYEGANATQVKVIEGQKVAEPEAPTREGYEFLGWLNGTEPYDFDAPVTSDLTLTASWKKTETPVTMHTVTFMNGLTVFATTELESGSTISKPQTDPVREGYTFVGWYLDGEMFDFGTAVTDDLTLVAGFKKNDEPEPEPEPQPDPEPEPQPEPEPEPQPQPEQKPADQVKPDAGNKGDLPTTGDAAAIASIVATAGSAIAYAGYRVKKRS